MSEQKSISERIEALKSRAGEANDRYRKAEEMIGSIPGAKRVSSGTLTWCPEAKRILQGDRHILGAKLEDRLRATVSIDGLIDAALLSAESLFDETGAAS